LIRQAVILVGGKGKRLGDLAGERPKPFVEISGKPFLDYLISHAACHGVREVVLLAGHAASWIRENYDCSVSGVDIKLCIEEKPMGTAGALLSAADFLDDVFLLLNGDSILNGSWSVLVPLLNDGKGAVIAARAVEDVSRYGRLVLESSKVTAFSEKQGVGPGLINAGIYLLRREMVMPLIGGACSMENDVLPQLITKGAVAGAEVKGYFLDIGLPETLFLARSELKNKLARRAVFFDRDNTLVEDSGYTHKPEDLKWMPGAREAVRAANDDGYGVFVVTNQAGIARGYYDVAAMHEFHAAMQADLYEIGAHIDQFYHCPHHPDGAIPDLSIACSCRKPGTGMLEQAFEDHALSKEGSFMIGDKPKDVACGKTYGLASFLYEHGTLLEVCERAGVYS
jgi:D,D-heptose 1,7-bisphosphate phosphatase